MLLKTVIIYWPLLSIVMTAGLCRLVHNAKVADRANLAANHNVKRLVIQSATPLGVPLRPKRMESDDSLRERA